MCKMSDQVKMGMLVYPHLGNGAVHLLIQFPLTCQNSAVAILKDDGRLLSFPPKLITGNHVGQKVVLLDNCHAGIGKFGLEHAMYP